MNRQSPFPAGLFGDSHDHECRACMRLADLNPKTEAVSTADYHSQQGRQELHRDTLPPFFLSIALSPNEQSKTRFCLDQREISYPPG